MPKPKMNPTVKIDFDGPVPPPPAHLCPVARKEYRRIAALLQTVSSGYLQAVDVAMLATYAQAFADVCRLTVVVRGRETLVSPKTGSEYMNPLAGALAGAYNRMTHAADKLGFSPNARKRIGEVIPKVEDDDPVAKFQGKGVGR